MCIKICKKIINTHEKDALNQKIRDRERLILEEKERGWQILEHQIVTHTHKKKNRDIPNRGFKYEAMFG